jgi:hypothetical protein
MSAEPQVSWDAFFEKAGLQSDPFKDEMVATLATQGCEPSAAFFALVCDPVERPSFFKTWRVGSWAKFFDLVKSSFSLPSRRAMQLAAVDQEADVKEVRLAITKSAGQARATLGVVLDEQLRDDASLYRAGAKVERRSTPERLALLSHQRLLVSKALEVGGVGYVPFAFTASALSHSGLLQQL